LFSDNPAPNTQVGTYVCVGPGDESITTNLLPDGAHSITYTETKNGQESAVSPSLTINIDTVIPSTPACSTSPNLAKSGTPVTTTCTGVDQDTTLTIPRMNCNPTPTDATHLVVCTGIVGSGVGEISTSNEVVRVDDQAGNRNDMSNTGLTVDLTSPNQPVIISPQNNSETREYSPVFSGTGEQRATVRVDDLHGHTCTAIVDSTSHWTCTISSAFNDGDNPIFYINQTDEAGNVSSPNKELSLRIRAPRSGSGGVFSSSPNSFSREQAKRNSSLGLGARDRNRVLDLLAPMNNESVPDYGPKFHEYKSWEPIESCLQYDPERPLEFTDLTSSSQKESNIIKNSFIIDPNYEHQYIISGYNTQKHNTGQSLFGPTQALSRLEWAKILMLSHCLPIYDYTLLPSITAYGNPMPNYTDLSRDSFPKDNQTKWLLDLAYSASYYEIMHGTIENEIQLNRDVSGAEAIKMFIKTGEFVHGSIFISNDSFSGGINKDTWYYEYFAKADKEGTLQEFIDTIQEARSPVLREQAISLLLEALFKRNLYQDLPL